MWKNLGNENLKKTTLPLIVVDQRLQENLEYFNSMGSTMINDARYTREIKSRIDIPKSSFNKKKNIFTNKLN
jgi:hypothetical protein